MLARIVSQFDSLHKKHHWTSITDNSRVLRPCRSPTWLPHPHDDLYLRRDRNTRCPLLRASWRCSWRVWRDDSIQAALFAVELLLLVGTILELRVYPAGLEIGLLGAGREIVRFPGGMFYAIQQCLVVVADTAAFIHDCAMLMTNDRSTKPSSTSCLRSFFPFLSSSAQLSAPTSLPQPSAYTSSTSSFSTSCT